MMLEMPSRVLDLTHRYQVQDYRLVTIEKLNGLSTDALYALAENLGLSLPEGLEPVFIISELIEAFNEDSRERRMDGNTAVHVEEKKFSGSELDEIDASLDVAACIECRYNETRLHALIRDPGWAFVFWDVRDDDFEKLLADSSFSGLFLRVIEDPAQPEPVQFDVYVGRNDSSWNIHLPEPDMNYSIDLCAKLGGKTTILAHHNRPIRTPRTLSRHILESMDEFSAELAILSGLNKLEPDPDASTHSVRIMDEYNA